MASGIRLSFRVTDGEYAVCRLSPDEPLPAWPAGAFLSLTRTPEELSIVCEAPAVPPDVRAERGWLLLQLEGPFAFDLTGILASFVAPLASARIPVFAVSTYDTDWVLVPSLHQDAALAALAAAGHRQVP